ncbi:hypothetical protein [Alicyclobacillus sp. SP_1]|uniref:hypothetical protein n=1 Tax=Alicyclobacillus sp. SP_1 TaxID=2942475 RepID=UPI0021587B8A|nr:hypothetical protein [Alicyclobacillus sp. SP_1]
MSGKGLAQFDAHHAIHQAAFDEAEQWTRILRKKAHEGQVDEALHLASVLLEHWETRTLRHADSEEEGLYQEIERAESRVARRIAQLTRDHDLMRTLVTEIEGILATHGWSDGVVERFEAMLLINAIHGRDEEKFLFQSGLPLADILAKER